MKKIFLEFGALIGSLTAISQECSNCKLMPRVANYDVEVQIPKLADTGETMLQWRQLFWLGRHASAYLYQKNSDCILFTQPIYVDEKMNETLLIGQTHTMLPGNGDVSEFGDYLLTGVVKNSGSQGLLHLELQTACSRKTVASAEVPFQMSSESNYIIGIAQQAASRLSPLIDKIKQFELKEREENRQVAISGFFSEEIKITPKKYKLKPGEDTEFEIEIKDCDGQPLNEMEVEFTKATIEGMSIDGTRGGTVSPGKLVTDASGKAKGKFKMNNGNSAAIINAHCLVKKPNGCQDAFVGSVEIGTIPHTKIVLDYGLYESNKIGMVHETEIDTFNVGGDRSFFMRSHRAVVYHYPAIAKGDIVAHIWPKPIPGLPPDPSKTFYAVDAGFYVFNKRERGKKGLETMTGTSMMEGDTVMVKSGNARGGSRPEIHFNIIKNEFKNFSIEFNYPGEMDNEDAHPGYPTGFIIESDDPGVKFSSKKITDPNSRYKMEYKVDLTRKIEEAVGLVFKKEGLEQITLTIYSTY